MIYRPINADNRYLLKFSMQRLSYSVLFPAVYWNNTIVFLVLGIILICFQGSTPQKLNKEPVSIFYVYVYDLEEPSVHDVISQKVQKIRYRLHWLDAITVEANDSQVGELMKLSCVDTVINMRADLYNVHHSQALSGNSNIQKPKWDTLLAQQKALMEFDVLEKNGYTGKGVRVAILDAGFKHADKHPAFRHLFENRQIVGTRDFYQGDNHVYHHAQHGTQVLGCLAGKYGDQWIGVAKDAQFLLARTEHIWWEKPAEEDHWIAALEWAYDQGAQILCSSLSFTYKEDNFQQMDGKTHPVSYAAAKAVEKGMLIVVSMGNEGNKSRMYLGSPADVPGVLSVGGSLPMIPMRIPFSSTGPNALNDIKPNIAAPAYVLTTKGNHNYGIGAGTSFSCPLVAGLAACLLEQNPEMNPAEVISRIESSGHYYPYYDYYMGYGVPEVSRIFEEKTARVDTSFQVSMREDTVLVVFSVPDTTGSSSQGKVIYYHLEHPRGYLKWAFYDLIPPDSRRYAFNTPSRGGMMRIWYEGYLYEQVLFDK